VPPGGSPQNSGRPKGSKPSEKASKVVAFKKQH
jgi:hypothetical protein